ncbi:MAG: metallophosphoesterase, partial [Clostridia bacterium]|nr:metallophosphoesterase [Clostridia bacterium]
MNEYVVKSDNIPSEFENFRIAHISDLHNSEFGKNNEKLIDTLKQTDADIIVITGDMIDSRNTDVDVAISFAQEAVNIAPTYYVNGNHESRIPEEYETLKKGLIDAGVTIL